MACGRTSSWPMVLSPEARQTLERWPRAPTSTAGWARRGKRLRLAAGSSPSAAAPVVGVQRTVVRHWATRVLAPRLDGLADAPGRGAKGGFSPRGRHPRRAPGLRTPGSAGSEPLPGGWRRPRAPAHRRGPGDRQVGGHRTPDAGGPSTHTRAPAGVALSHAAAGRRRRGHGGRTARPRHAAAASRCPGRVRGRDDLPTAATAAHAEPASPAAAPAEPLRARVQACRGPHARGGLGPPCWPGLRAR
jgi:hypothetical protein